MKKAGDLGRNQVENLVHLTNQAAYLDQHKKLAGHHRYVVLKDGPVRVEEVIKQATGLPEPVIYRSLDDYKDAPPGKHASWEEIFPGAEKVAAAVEDEAVSSLVEHHFKQALYDARTQESNWRSDIETLEVELERAKHATIEQMKNAHREGSTLNDIARAMGTVSTDPEILESTFKVAYEQLVRVGNHTADSYMASIKTASPGQLRAEGTPLCAAYEALIDTATKLAYSRKIHRLVEQKLAALKDVSKLASAAPAEPGGVGASIAKHLKLNWNRIQDAGNALNRHGAAFGREMGGEGGALHWLGGHLGTPLKVAPYAVGAGLGYKGVQHALAFADSPAGRRLQRFIPGTDEAEMDNMMIRERYGAGYGGGY